MAVDREHPKLFERMDERVMAAVAICRKLVLEAGDFGWQVDVDVVAYPSSDCNIICASGFQGVQKRQDEKV